MTNKKNNIELEEFKYLIDSRNLSDKKRKENADAIMKAYLSTPDYDIKNSFSNFLRLYIDTIYAKRKNFAIDMSINPLMLNQVLTNSRLETNQ